MVVSNLDCCEMQVPTLLTAIEASYQDEKHVHVRRYKYVKPLLPQETTINIQLQLTIEIAPNYIELVVGINHVRVHVANASWDERRMGHFPARIELSVTPTSERAGTVSMTGSSTNTSYKVGVSEQVRVGLHTTLKAAASAGLTFTAGTSSASKVEAKPWNLEQLPVHTDRGGKFVWTLTNLRGAGSSSSLFWNPPFISLDDVTLRFGNRSVLRVLSDDVLLNVRTSLLLSFACTVRT